MLKSVLFGIYCRSSLGALVCVLAVLKFARNQEVRAALCEREDSPLAILPDDGVHFPISKALTISLDRSVMYADSVWYIFNLCSAVFSPMSVVFHLVTAMLLQSLIAPNMLVDTLMRDLLTFLAQVSRYLFRRPLVLLKIEQRLPNQLGFLARVAGGSFLPSVSHGLGFVPKVVPFCRGIALDLTING